MDEGEPAVLVKALEPFDVGTETDRVEVFILPAEAFADRGLEELVEPPRGLAGGHLGAEFAGREGLIAFDGDRCDLQLTRAGLRGMGRRGGRAHGAGAHKQGGTTCAPPCSYGSIDAGRWMVHACGCREFIASSHKKTQPVAGFTL
jgi:hypothetical protein